MGILEKIEKENASRGKQEGTNSPPPEAYTQDQGHRDQIDEEQSPIDAAEVQGERNCTQSQTRPGHPRRQLAERKA